MPAAAYLSPEVFEWEMAHLYDATWVCAGRADELGEPGDQRAVSAGSTGILLIRGSDGELAGFFNTCRHRGHELLPCGGSAVNRDHVRCPYHRWVYALDGTLRGGPGLASQPGFDRSDPENDLVEARVEEWRGWLFVNVSGDAPELAIHVGRLDDLIEDYEPTRLFTGARCSYDLRANWKVIAENYHECYHCSEIHPELCRVSAPGSGEDWAPSGATIGGSMGLNAGAETMSLDGRSLGVAFRRLQGTRLRDVHYIQVFPNLLLSIHPDYVMAHRLEPLSPGVTRVECEWLFPPEALERLDFDPGYAAEFWDITNREDWSACEAVQRGIAGPGYRQAPFSDQERCVAQAMAFVARAYLEGGIVLAPADEPARS